MNKYNFLIKEAIDSGDYIVNNLGRIYKRTKNGYTLMSEHLHKPTKRFRTRIYGYKIFTHRVVGYYKFGDELFYPEVEIHHIDGNQQNNSPDNLSLVPRGTHLSKFHSGENNKASKVTWNQVHGIRTLWKNGLHNYNELARRSGISATSIKKIILDQRWKEPIDTEKQ